jgi:hypothetical protein
MSLLTPHDTGPLHREGASDLCVFIDCHSFLCAFAVSGIDRLILADEVDLGDEDGAPRSPARPLSGQHLVGVAGFPFVAWDLSLLLAVAPASRAFLLLRIAHGDHEIPIALRTGPCLFVEPLRTLTPVPQGVFRSRRGAIAGAFAVGSRTGGSVKTAAKLGLYLDPRHLWTSDDLDTSRRTLEREGILEHAT